MTREPSNTSTGSYSINRRALLALFSLGTVSSVPKAVAARKDDLSNSPDRSGRVLPWEQTRYPRPLSAEELGHRQYVPAEKTIHHTVAWKTVADEDRGKLEEFFEVAEFKFRIDGKKVSPSEGSWSWEKVFRTNAESDSQAQWRRQWTYSTPPKDPGTHEFGVVINYNQPFTSKVSGGESKTRSGVQAYEGEYTVTQPLSPTSQSIGSELDASHG